MSVGSVSGWETKMPQAARPKKKKKKGSLDLFSALHIFFTTLWVCFLEVILALSRRSILFFYLFSGSVYFFSFHLFIYFGCAGSLMLHVDIL